MPRHKGWAGAFLEYMKWPNETDKELARRMLLENDSYRLSGWWEAQYYSHYAEGFLLVGQDLSGLRLKYAHFQRANLTGARLADGVFDHVRFNQSQFSRCDFTNAKFVQCDLGYTVWSGATLKGCVMQDCRLTGVDLTRLKALGAKVRGKQFDGPEDDDQD